MKRIVCLVLALSLVLVLFAGCANKGKEEETPELGEIGGKIQYAFWGDELERQEKEKFCADFAEKYADKGVECEFVHIPDDYYLKLQTLAAAHNMPDVYGTTAERISELAAVSLDLSEFKETHQDLVADISEGCLLSGEYQGKCYAIGTSLDPYCMAVNKDIFSELGVELPKEGWTMDDLGELLPKLTKKDGDKTDYYAMAVTVYRCDYVNFIANFGGTFFKDGKSCWSTDENTKKAVQFLVDACQNGYSPSPAMTSSNNIDTEQLFITGKIAMFPSGFWEINAFWSTCDFDWTFVSMPCQQGVSPVNPYVSAGAMVSKETKNLATVYAFYEYMLDPQSTMSSFKAGLSMPGFKSLQDSSLVEYGEKLDLEPYWKAADYGYCQSHLDLMATGKSSQCLAIANAELTLAYDGSQDVATTLANIDSKIEEILASEV